MVWPQRRDVANDTPIIEDLDSVATHTADNGLPDRAAEIGGGHAKQRIDVLA